MSDRATQTIPIANARDTLTRPPRPAMGEIVPNPKRPGQWLYFFRDGLATDNGRATDGWTIDCPCRSATWLPAGWERSVELIPLDITRSHLEHWLRKAPHDFMVAQNSYDPRTDDGPNGKDYVDNALLMFRQLGITIPPCLRIEPDEGSAISDRRSMAWLNTMRTHLLQLPVTTGELSIVNGQAGTFETESVGAAKEVTVESDPIQLLDVLPDARSLAGCMSVGEIAAALGQSKDAVESWLRRFAKKHPDCRVPIETPCRNKPRYLYIVESVMPGLKAHFG